MSCHFILQSLYFARFVKKDDLEQSVRSVLKELITKKPASEFTFKGQTKGKKKFESLKIWDLVCGKPNEKLFKQCFLLRLHVAKCFLFFVFFVAIFINGLLDLLISLSFLVCFFHIFFLFSSLLVYYLDDKF